MEQSGDGVLENYRKVLDETVILTIENRKFRAKDHIIAFYEQSKGELFEFYRKKSRRRWNSRTSTELATVFFY